MTSAVTALRSKSDKGLNSGCITSDSERDECGVGNVEAWTEDRC